jgi:formylglycine-generating enzyme required for sulfatase activity
LISSGTDRNGIEISSSGTNSTDPAVYGCDLNNNGVYDETDDGEWIACNYLSWADLAAFLDWAALRPITELEYEKIGRGTAVPVQDEYSWGSTTIVGLAAISNDRQTGEVSNTTNANAVYNNNFTSGPARVGIFATASSDRVASGGSYYGVMEICGNVWEQVIKFENSTGRAFTGLSGNGILTSNGDADTSNWPDYMGACKRGGGWLTAANYTQLSSRYGATLNGSSRNSETGGRGAR